MRKTKIVCTLGPASDSEEIIEKLILSGMDAARFNFSHGTHESHLALLTRFKHVRDNLGHPVATILDTKGPEIRIRTFSCGRVTLAEGDAFTLTTRPVDGDGSVVSVTYENLHQEITPGCHILVDDGLVDLEVEQIDGQDIRCRVVTGGELSSNKSINIPGVHIHLPALTEKDKEDLRFGVENDFDFIAASFVRQASDVEEIRAVLDSLGGRDIGIIAKIENREGVDNLDSIVDVSDGIMVARGDMGVEIPAYEVPIVQKKMIKSAIGKGKRSPEVVRSCQETGSVYLCTVGGIAALLAKSVTESELVGWEDLGTEALRKLTLKDFPVYVAVDTKGGDLYREIEAAAQ